MKNEIAAVLVVGVLLSTSGSSLAAGKLDGAGSGLDLVGGSGPVFAGKIGGVGGADEFLLPPSLLAGKLGGAGGADEFLLPPSLLGGKLGGAGGMDEFLLGEPDDAPSTTIVSDTVIDAAGGNE